MKLSALVTIAAVIGGSFLIPVPAEAQYYGQGYGYNNRSANSYGPNPYARSNQRPSSNKNFQPNYRSTTRNYGSGTQSNGCSTLSMSNYGC